MNIIITILNKQFLQTTYSPPPPPPPPPPPSPEGCSLVVLLAPHHHLTLMCISEQRNGLSVKGHTVRTYVKIKIIIIIKIKVKIPILRLGRELQNHTCNSSTMMLICKFIL